MNIWSSPIPLLLVSLATGHLQAGLKPGSYVKSTYIQALKRTRSPRQSLGSGGILEFVVTVANGKTELLPISDFHDSGIRYILQQNSVAVRSDHHYPEENFQVAPQSDGSFLVGTPGAFNGRFEFVGSTEDLLRSQTVAGEYLDSLGRKWVFCPDGKASTPGRQFSYRVACDLLGTGFDYLFGPNIEWAFESHGNALNLFKCTGEGPDSHEAKPFVTLKRVAQ